ncbi:glycosyltransferase family 4 protein [Pseudarthrobacter sp. P1]|uniref:glycosyltransferase family 4 protein n=1 Tax=Pseudarthrobacter sp. P1 TaxID=3418418 RepID=UPI003CEB0B75
MQPFEPGTGYVLKMYPRFSETFVVSEILAREAAGERIEIFSLRPPTDPRFHPELARVQAPVTYVERSQKTQELWDSLRLAEDRGLGARLGGHLGELAAADPDDAVQAINLAVTLQGRNIVHLHAHFGTVATSVARLASRLTGIPYSFTAHAVDIFCESVDGAVLRTKLEQAHHTVTISEFNFNYLRRRYPDATDRLHLVRNGLELTRFPYRNPPPVAETVRVAAVGRLVEKKGFGQLITAAAILLGQDRRLDVRIAGNGPLAGDLQGEIDRLRIGGSVELLGPQTQDEVQALLRWADVFVAPCIVGHDGNADGMPTVLLEAMAIGVPCIGTDVTGIPEALLNRRTGLLIPAGDPQRLAEAIVEISGPGIDRLALARNARAVVERDYDSRHQAQRLRALADGKREAEQCA